MTWSGSTRELVLCRAPKEWTVPIHALRIGELGTWSPRRGVQPDRSGHQASPFAQTMNIIAGVSTVGYVATDQAVDEGSYETRLCRM